MNIINKIKMKIRGEVSTEALVKRGMKVGKNFSRQAECLIDYGFCWLIEIGDNVVLGPRSTILTHDATTKMWLGKTKIGKVTIGNNVFIGSNSVILPNVIIGNNVIIGAGSVVSTDVPDGVVACGIPARPVCTIEDYLNKMKKNMDSDVIFNENIIKIGGDTTESNKELVRKVLKSRFGFTD